MKIDIKKAREIIADEIQKYLSESIDHEGIRNIIDNSSRLLGQIEKFEEDASHSMINAMGPELEKIKSVLESIIKNPESYLPKEQEFKVKKKVPTHKLITKNVSGTKSVGPMKT